MKKYFFTICLLGLVSALSSQERRTENNGNLVLEDIPAIPKSIKENLSKFQNVRSAAFRGFNNKNEGLYISTRFGNVSQLLASQKCRCSKNSNYIFSRAYWIGSYASNSIIYSFYHG